MIKLNLNTTEISGVFAKALLKKDLIVEDDTAVIFYALSLIDERIKSMQRLFPSDTLHAVAVKANPLPTILTKCKENILGAEVASLPELFMAQKAGIAPHSIVFDSPCKTKSEIEYALMAGVYINADSFDELDRIAEILKTIRSKSRIGLRVNPQVGPGSIRSTSVADGTSKFGIPIHSNKEKIIDYFCKHNWLTGIHVHIGSQGCEIALLIDGIRKVLDLANEINSFLYEDSIINRIEYFDIGGGLPVSYHLDKPAVSLLQYQLMLKEACPELFTGKYKLITEFGRYIYANTGWVASKVEYVKREKEYNIIMTHVGADLFLRKCYNPSDWHHHITIVDKNGKLKNGTDKNKYFVAGPLCFGGDVLARDLELPVTEEGDYLLIHDAGAYTLSMWSRYNSRQIPKVIGYCAGDNTFEMLKERETKEDLFAFWS